MPFETPLISYEDDFALKIPLCFFCRHTSFSGTNLDSIIRTKTCKAFPEGIPRQIYVDRYDHRNPYPNDNDIQFEMYETIDTLHPIFSNRSPRQIQASIQRVLDVAKTKQDY